MVRLLDVDTYLQGRLNIVEIDVLAKPLERVQAEVTEMLRQYGGNEAAIFNANGFAPLDPIGLQLVQLCRVAALVRRHGPGVLGTIGELRKRIDDVNAWFSDAVHGLMPDDEEHFTLECWAAVGPRPVRGGWYVDTASERRRREV
jgi:hypothetical protein